MCLKKFIRQVGQGVTSGALLTATDGSSRKIDQKPWGYCKEINDIVTHAKFHQQGTHT